MKNVKSSTRRSPAKRGSLPKTVDEYFASVPEPARSTLSRMREAIRLAVPREATEAISYGMPAFKHNGVLVWYGAFANHCSLFPTNAVLETFKNDLKGYTVSKGTIRFPTDGALPVGLIQKLVKTRIAQLESKKR